MVVKLQIGLAYVIVGKFALAPLFDNRPRSSGQRASAFYGRNGPRRDIGSGRGAA